MRAENQISPKALSLEIRARAKTEDWFFKGSLRVTDTQTITDTQVPGTVRPETRKGVL